MAPMSTNRIGFFRLPIWPALLSAFVVPGAGQIVNKEIQKGLFLFFVFLGSFYWFFKVLSEQIALLTSISPEEWQKNPTMIQEYLVKIINQNPNMFFTFQILVLLVWGYSVIDAYITARQILKMPSPILSDETADSDN